MSTLNNPQRVAVLMTCFNRRTKTFAALNSLRENFIEDVSVKVYLVDDASTDGTATSVAKEFPDIDIIEGTGELFWGGGMRLAFKRAASVNPDFILWLNDDVVLNGDALDRLLSSYRNFRNSGMSQSIVVGTTCDVETGKTTYGGVKRTSHWRQMHFTTMEPADIAQRCETFNGNIVLIPHQVYSILGNIDRGFTHSMGDFDYGLRAKSSGCTNFVAPGYFGFCSKNATTATFRDPTLRRRERLRSAIAIKGMPPKEWARFCRRYAGPMWPIFALSPYLKMVIRRPSETSA